MGQSGDRRNRFILPGSGAETEAGPRLMLMLMLDSCDSTAAVIIINKNNKYISGLLFFFLVQFLHEVEKNV